MVNTTHKFVYVKDFHLLSLSTVITHYKERQQYTSRTSKFQANKNIHLLKEFIFIEARLNVNTASEVNVPLY